MILLHADEPVGHEYPGKGQLGLQQVYRLITAHPALKLVLAHWGGGFPFYELMPEVRKAAANVYYDTAASPLLYDTSVYRWVVGMAGAARSCSGRTTLAAGTDARRLPGFAGAIGQVTGLDLSGE